MKTKSHDRILASAFIAGVVSVATIACVIAFSFGQLIVRGVVEFFANGRINGAYLSLIVIGGLFLVSAKFVYINWKENTTFIIIAENHREVEPVNRRDEFVEL